jgi:predicted nucleic acid-binding protein
MTGVVVVDANLLVLLVVGSASKDYIAKHRRLQGYTVYDFELLGLILTEFSDIVLLPHVLAEVSSLVRKIDNPARAEIQNALKILINTAAELPIQSTLGVQRDEFDELGLTDAVILHLCTMRINGISPTLVTVDSRLANSAHSLGYSVIDYKQLYQTE